MSQSTRPYAVLVNTAPGGPAAAGANLLIFPGDATSLVAANAIAGGTTDAKGYFVADLQPYSIYKFTTTAGSGFSGSFLAGGGTIVEIDPTNNSGAVPGGGPSGAMSSAVSFASSFSGTFSASALLTSMVSRNGAAFPGAPSTQHILTPTLSGSGLVSVSFAVPNALNAANTNILGLHVSMTVSVGLTSAIAAGGTYPGDAALIFFSATESVQYAATTANLFASATTGNAFEPGFNPVTVVQSLAKSANTSTVTAGFAVAPQDPNGILTGVGIVVNVHGLVTPLFA